MYELKKKSSWFQRKASQNFPHFFSHFSPAFNVGFQQLKIQIIHLGISAPLSSSFTTLF